MTVPIHRRRSQFRRKCVPCNKLLDVCQINALYYGFRSTKLFGFDTLVRCILNKWEYIGTSKEKTVNWHVSLYKVNQLTERAQWAHLFPTKLSTSLIRHSIFTIINTVKTLEAKVDDCASFSYRDESEADLIKLENKIYKEGTSLCTSQKFRIFCMDNFHRFTSVMNWRNTTLTKRSTSHQS